METYTRATAAFYRSVFPDKNAPDGIGISLNIQVSHNAAKNKTATAEDGPNASSNLDILVSDPVSSAYLLVTESMILAGEAIGRFQSVIGGAEADGKFKNCLRLPFRSQRKPGTLRLQIRIQSSLSFLIELMFHIATPIH